MDSPGFFTIGRAHFAHGHQIGRKLTAMTYKELSDTILSMSAADQARLVCVWPPNDCPAKSSVPVVEIVKNVQGYPILSTGKTPTTAQEAIH